MTKRTYAFNRDGVTGKVEINVSTTEQVAIFPHGKAADDYISDMRELERLQGIEDQLSSMIRRSVDGSRHAWFYDEGAAKAFDKLMEELRSLREINREIRTKDSNLTLRPTPKGLSEFINSGMEGQCPLCGSPEAPKLVPLPTPMTKSEGSFEKDLDQLKKEEGDSK